MRASGLTYRSAFLSPDEEQFLIERVETIAFDEVRMHGVVAKRMTKHFGWSYDYEGWRIEPTEPAPEWLEPFLARAAETAGVERARFEQVMVARYPPGGAIGWHRDAPMFGSPVVGISVGSACLMRFRRGKVRAWETHAQLLEPRSLYILDGAARTQWQHAIPKTPELRWSITMRTLRQHIPAKAT
jgi:alkylated DNA repair protein (DNA oxidative demethylase)